MHSSSHTRHDGYADAMESIETIVGFLEQQSAGTWTITDPIAETDENPELVLPRLSAAFLRVLGGDSASDSIAARYLDHMASDPRWGPVAAFYLEGVNLVNSELGEARRGQPEFLIGLDALADLLAAPTLEIEPSDLNEAFWSAFFPEATGILGKTDLRCSELRERRKVTIDTPLDRCMDDPGRQLLLTTNALLTIPAPDASTPREAGEFSDQLAAVGGETQQHWYDHPIPVGVADTHNEILYGLRAMDSAIAFEKRRGVINSSCVMPVVMSVSVTHAGLSALAHRYVEDLIRSAGGLRHIDVFIFSEEATRRFVEDVLEPAMSRYLPDNDASLLDVLSVDGRYGRHYSFLKAIAAWWSVMVGHAVIGTYKFDLDQVFPQDQLVEQTGRSAMEHFTNPTWGARGTDARGGPVELGMMAGSLVNSSDIDSSLFALDVDYPTEGPTLDETVFWSALPQALSTAAEMGTRYGADDIDGIRSALERVHVTGGTTAIRIDALRRHRPFTPGFIARAEDQAYLMSVYPESGPRLACLHDDSLIMRHDKDSFATDAIRVAAVGKLVGDFERIIVFSAYARASSRDVDGLKRHLDPYTGCFVSRIPLTVTYLRFALRALRFFAEDEPSDGITFTEQGAARISKAIRYVSEPASSLRSQLDRERSAWDLFFDVLDSVEDALSSDDRFASDLLEKSREFLDEIAIRVQ